MRIIFYGEYKDLTEDEEKLVDSYDISIGYCLDFRSSKSKSMIRRVTGEIANSIAVSGDLSVIPSELSHGFFTHLIIEPDEDVTVADDWKINDNIYGVILPNWTDFVDNPRVMYLHDSLDYMSEGDIYRVDRKLVKHAAGYLYKKFEMEEHSDNFAILVTGMKVINAYEIAAVLDEVKDAIK